jgi:hypothetical protein
MALLAKWRSLLFLATLACAVAGCGNQHGSSEAPPPVVLNPATTGSITGIATLDGTPPTFKPIDMSASAVCAAANPSPVIPPTVVTGAQGALANVVVYVRGGLGNYKFDVPPEPVVLSQKNCMYEPHVVALMTNQPFLIENHDLTLHNVHPMPKHNRQWSTSQPVGSAPLKSSFARPEFAIPVLCNLHPWMRAFVFVVDHPYFAVTSITGKFELRNLPPGTYTLEAWQETYGTKDQTVTIGPRESRAVSFTFKAAAPSGD